MELLSVTGAFTAGCSDLRKRLLPHQKQFPTHGTCREILLEREARANLGPDKGKMSLLIDCPLLSHT